MLPIAEYQEWPFRCFLKRTRIGHDTTYNLEFQLQHILEPLHLPILSQALNVDSDELTSTKTFIPYNNLHSKERLETLQAKRKRVL